LHDVDVYSYDVEQLEGSDDLLINAPLVLTHPIGSCGSLVVRELDVGLDVDVKTK